MPRVLLLLPTTTYRTHAFMEAAQRLGVEITAASEEANALARLNPSGLLQLDFSDPQRAARQVFQFAEKHPIAAVVPVDNQVTVCAAAICEALGLRHNSVESATAARNKHRMRELLGQAGVPQPRYKLCSLDDDIVSIADQIQYPCVVKPLTLSGSRGVIRANTDLEFVQAIVRLDHILRSEFSKSHSVAGTRSRPEHSLPAAARPRRDVAFPKSASTRIAKSSNRSSTGSDNKDGSPNRTSSPGPSRSSWSSDRSSGRSR